MVCSSLFFVLQTRVAQVCTQVYPPLLNNKNKIKCKFEINTFFSLLFSTSDLKGYFNWSLYHCTALHFAPLHCTLHHCTALHCTALHYTAIRNANIMWNPSYLIEDRNIYFTCCDLLFTYNFYVAVNVTHFSHFKKIFYELWTNTF